MSSRFDEFTRRLTMYWNDQDERLMARVSNPAIVIAALATIEGERSRGIPINALITFESAAETAELAIREHHRQKSSKGGRAPKIDSLQRLIEEIVSNKPFITERELLDCLLARTPGSVIEEIDEKTIHFDNGNKELDGAPISGLKDRLSRAKKKINGGGNSGSR